MDELKKFLSGDMDEEAVNALKAKAPELLDALTKMEDVAAALADIKKQLAGGEPETKMSLSEAISAPDEEE